MKKIISIVIAVLMLTACNGGLNLTEHEQKAVEAISYYKSILKDPCSLRIYGDVHLLESNSNDNGFILIYADAKNSYGGYGGKEPIEITCIYADEEIQENVFIVRDKYTEGYHDLSSKLYDYAKYADGTLPLTYYKINGNKVAKSVNAKYVE